MSVKILSEKKVFENKSLTIKDYDLEFEDGFKETWSLSESFDGTMVIPVDEDNNVYLLREYCLGAKKAIYVSVKGRIDEGETSLKAAKRELREEAGLKAKNYKLLTSSYPSPSYSSCVSYIYLATDLKEVEKWGGDEHHEMELVKMPFSEALEMVYKGEIKTMSASLGLLLAKERLGL